MEKGKIIDVVGVVERVDPWTMISKKNGEETSKRPLILRDKTNCEIEVLFLLLVLFLMLLIAPDFC